jgi:Transposase DDE domain group 1
VGRPIDAETTAHRVLKSVDADLLEAIRGARAKALERAWDAGARPKELILDIDASLLTAHSEKQGAAGNYKGGFGFHPLLCYLAETGEPLAAILRPGNAAAHTAADHFEVLQAALEQLPAADLRREILVRTDIGGRTHAFAQDCRDAGIRFSVDYEVDARVREAIRALGESAWQSALDGDGTEREGASCARAGARCSACLAPGRGPRRWSRRSRGCERCRPHRVPDHRLAPQPQRPLDAPADLGLLASGPNAPTCRWPTTKRSARAAPRNRPGAVTYPNSPGLTLLGENGGSRLVKKQALDEAVA